MMLDVSLWGKLVKAYRQGTLSVKMVARAHHAWLILRSVRYAVHNPAAKRIHLHCPDYVKPDPTERPLVKRIFAAFLAMKEAEPAQSVCYRPSELWRGFLDKAYSHLNEGLASNDLDRFHFFLANFGAWKQYTAVETSTLIRNHSNWWLGRLYLQNDVFNRQLQIWQ